MATTNWRQLYAPTLLTNTSATAIITVGANTSNLITKFTVSNITATAATFTVEITPSGGTKRQVWQGTIPGYPTQGGNVEITQIEGHILAAGDVITVTAGTANALVPEVSGVVYTS